MSEDKKFDIIRALVDPQTTLEKIAHELAEFVVYGEIYSRIKEAFIEE